ncbi:hypothetical protein PIB30_069235 [Stylosanthes scabra]|uniref:Uncharacterized protein n=1 Tax=Stylosanthes scabra TaxID=79078 RepID=A0ABU6UMJ0_9FABA|nr:hypothetical protein [Stylosanthes scabra]
MEEMVKAWPKLMKDVKSITSDVLPILRACTSEGGGHEVKVSGDTNGDKVKELLKLWFVKDSIKLAPLFSMSNLCFFVPVLRRLSRCPPCDDFAVAVLVLLRCWCCYDAGAAATMLVLLLCWSRCDAGAAATAACYLDQLAPLSLAQDKERSCLVRGIGKRVHEKEEDGQGKKVEHTKFHGDDTDELQRMANNNRRCANSGDEHNKGAQRRTQQQWTEK